MITDLAQWCLIGNMFLLGMLQTLKDILISIVLERLLIRVLCQVQMKCHAKYSVSISVYLFTVPFNNAQILLYQ